MYRKLVKLGQTTDTFGQRSVGDLVRATEQLGSVAGRFGRAQNH